MITGSEFCKSIWNLPPGPEREHAIYDAILAGSYLSQPMTQVPLANGRGYLQVCDDYVCIGTPDDFVRIPMCAPTAQRVANHLGFVLPSAKVVDLIAKAATVKLKPAPKIPDPAKMMGVPYFVEHNATIELARQQRTGLLVGVKKTIVVTNRLIRQSGRVPIYGWENLNGTNTQPLSLIHEALWYVDYSHGVRLVHPVVRIDDTDYPLEEVIADPVYSPLFCYAEDSPLKVTRLSLDEGAPPRKSVPEVIEKTPPSGMKISIPPPPGGDLAGVVFRQAKNYGPKRTVPVTLVVLHDMEADETKLTAENVGGFFAGQPAHGSIVGGKEFKGSSCTYGVDCDSIMQYVREGDVAWHAPGANHNGIGIEHAGYARQTAEEWQDEYSDAMLHLSAKLVAGICQRHGIPVEFVDDAGLLAGMSGITTHVCVSKAFKKSTHTDPGKNFPVSYYIGLVQQYFEVVDDPYGDERA